MCQKTFTSLLQMLTDRQLQRATSVMHVRQKHKCATHRGEVEPIDVRRNSVITCGVEAIGVRTVRRFRSDDRREQQTALKGNMHSILH